jgi:hypothetical protein
VRENKDKVVVVFDGDQRKLLTKHRKKFLNLIETNVDGAADWFDQHVSFLPGDTWPERWLILTASSDSPEIASKFGANNRQAKDALDFALQQDKHSEIWGLAQKLAAGVDETVDRLCLVCQDLAEQEFTDVLKFLESKLK